MVPHWLRPAIAATVIGDRAPDVFELSVAAHGPIWSTFAQAPLEISLTFRHNHCSVGTAHA